VLGHAQLGPETVNFILESGLDLLILPLVYVGSNLASLSKSFFLLRAKVVDGRLKYTVLLQQGLIRSSQGIFLAHDP
jgi:hypothetical protein